MSFKRILKVSGKAIIYRIYQSFLITPLLFFVLFGDLKGAFAFGAAEFFVKGGSYWIFEFMWEKMYPKMRAFVFQLFGLSD